MIVYTILSGQPLLFFFIFSFGLFTLHVHIAGGVIFSMLGLCYMIFLYCCIGSLYSCIVCI